MKSVRRGSAACRPWTLHYSWLPLHLSRGRIGRVFGAGPVVATPTTPLRVGTADALVVTITGCVDEATVAAGELGAFSNSWLDDFANQLCLSG